MDKTSDKKGQEMRSNNTLPVIKGDRGTLIPMNISIASNPVIKGDRGTRIKMNISIASNFRIGSRGGDKMKYTFYLTDNQLEAFKLLGLTPEENEKKHKFEDGDKYFFIFPYGDISDSTWANDNIDSAFESIGNCFDNIEDARFALEQLKVIHELKQYTIKSKPVWDCSCYYFLKFDHNTGKININSTTSLQMMPNSMYFESFEKAFKAIYEIGEERLKKYWFEIEE